MFALFERFRTVASYLLPAVVTAAPLVAPAAAETEKSFRDDARVSQAGENGLRPLAFGLSFGGKVCYQISGSLARLQADQIQNSRPSGTSGPLRLSLWATREKPVFGRTISGYDMATYEFPGGSSFYNVDSGSVPFTRPPDGTYYVTMFLDEYDLGNYYYVDFTTFTALLGCSGGVCSPGSSCTFGAPSCSASATVLCLNNNRYRVTGGWRAFDGTTGAGTAVPLTADTGYFWFFSSANVEIIIKVLNACAPPFPRYWVFAAGLTNVEVTLTVTDTQTGSVKTYFNPLGTAFAPVQDTNAFATCP